MWKLLSIRFCRRHIETNRTVIDPDSGILLYIRAGYDSRQHHCKWYATIYPKEKNQLKAVWDCPPGKDTFMSEHKKKNPSCFEVSCVTKNVDGVIVDKFAMFQSDLVRLTNFNFSAFQYSRLIHFKELDLHTLSSNFQSTLKKLFEGDEELVDVKYSRPVKISSVPIIITSNYNSEVLLRNFVTTMKHRTKLSSIEYTFTSQSNYYYSFFSIIIRFEVTFSNLNFFKSI